MNFQKRSFFKKFKIFNGICNCSKFCQFLCTFSLRKICKSLKNTKILTSIAYFIKAWFSVISVKMSAARQLSRHLKELRIHLCQTSSASAGAREFINTNYITLKTANPEFPILVRECSGIQVNSFTSYSRKIESQNVSDTSKSFLLIRKISPELLVVMLTDVKKRLSWLIWAPLKLTRLLLLWPMALLIKIFSFTCNMSYLLINLEFKNSQ